MKKKLSIAGMLLMVCMLFCISKTTYAASRTITTNKSYDVILGNETKNYTVIVPNSGYFYYTVIPIKYIENGIESSSSSWYLPSTKMKVGYKLYEEQSVYYGRPFTSAAYSFKKGTRVNISLTDTNSSNTYAYYRLKVITKNPENFEKENNNSRNTATKILCNKTYSGLSQQDDKDWWCFTAPKTGKYKFYCVEIKDNKYQTVKAYYGARLISATTMRSNQGWATLYRGTLKKGQKIYILLDNGSKNEFSRLKVKQIG